MSLTVRKISVKVVGANMLSSTFIDLVHFIGAIYLLVRYFTHFDISRTLTRPEEKYYKMFLSTEENGVQPKVIFVYLVITVLNRLLYYMVYFDTFGALIQIILKMVVF